MDVTLLPSISPHAEPQLKITENLNEREMNTNDRCLRQQFYKRKLTHINAFQFSMETHFNILNRILSFS